jgi:hypothetical protein
LGTSTGRASSIAVTIVTKLSRWAASGGSDADTVGEIISGVTGIAEGVGETAEAVGRAAAADTASCVSVG